MKLTSKQIKKLNPKRYSRICSKSLKINCLKKKWEEIKKYFFDPSKPNSDNRAKNLLDVKKILDERNITFYLVRGALLGIYREGDFIKWDDDTEIDVFEDAFLRQYEKLCELFMSIGFVVRGRKPGFEGKPGEKINLYRNGEKLTIRGLLEDETGKFFQTKVYRYPRKFYENFETIEFKGAIFRVPSPIEDYIVYVYGKDWKIPIKSKNDCIVDFAERGIRRKTAITSGKLQNALKDRKNKKRKEK